MIKKGHVIMPLMYNENKLFVLSYRNTVLYVNLMHEKKESCDCSPTTI